MFLKSTEAQLSMNGKEQQQIDYSDKQLQGEKLYINSKSQKVRKHKSENSDCSFTSKKNSIHLQRGKGY